jgi:glycosyltransferase involved in cell wall biosynthesis
VPERILFAGTICPRKNVLGLIEGFAAAVNGRTGCELRLAGAETDKAYATQCRELAAQLGVAKRVTFLGSLRIEQIKEELARCAFLALCSFQETAPMAIAEAMAAGAPVLASSVGGVPWMVAEGITGRLVLPAERKDIVRGMLSLLKSQDMHQMAERLELSIYRHAVGVTGQSSDIIESVRKRSPHTRTEVVTNGVECARFGRDKADEAARELLGCQPGPIFLYAGLIGLAQGLDQVLDLAKSLPPTVPGRFALVGEGPERGRLEQRIKVESINRVRILGPQPRERIPALLGAANVAIITLGMSIPGAVPSKIYEAMASELPIMLIADGEASRRVKEAGCGLAVRPGDLETAHAAFCELIGDCDLRQRLGTRGRAVAETTYSRDAITGRLDRFLRSILAEQADRHSLNAPQSHL